MSPTFPPLPCLCGAHADVGKGGVRVKVAGAEEWHLSRPSMRWGQGCHSFLPYSFAARDARQKFLQPSPLRAASGLTPSTPSLPGATAAFS